jgi:hypothetical protein
MSVTAVRWSGYVHGKTEIPQATVRVAHTSAGALITSIPSGDEIINVAPDYVAPACLPKYSADRGGYLLCNSPVAFRRHVNSVGLS